MATYARKQFTVTDQAGNVVPGAWIEVKHELIGGQPLVAIFQDRAGTEPPLTNPFQADGNGFAFYHAAKGVHRIRAYLGPSGSPTFEKVWDYVPIGTSDELDFSTDTTLGGGSPSDSLVPTQAAVKSYIDSVAAVARREVLSGNRTYYVRMDGNDSNNGLANTSGGAFLTLQRAWNVIVSTLDLAGFTVTVQIADGTYTGGVDMLIPTIGGGVIFNGNSGATSNVIISTTNDDCFYLNAACQISIRYMKLQTATSGNCLLARYPGAKMFLVNVNFGSCPAVHVSSQYGAVIECASNYTVSGNANVHLQAYLGGTLDFYSHTATMSGTPAWGTAFAQCSMTGKASLFSVTYSGSATGKRYVADTNGVLQTYGAGTASTYFPGNSNGTTATGGVQA